MKHAFNFALSLTFLLAVTFSCQKAPELTITSPASIDLSADGSSGSITFTANRAWRVSSSDFWVTLSPSSGEPSEAPVTVSVRCIGNTTYEDRTATVTITMEDLSQSVTVRQPANKGIVLPTQSYDLQSGAKSIEVTVQANVDYTVETSVDWIKQTGTKGLTSKTLNFSIEENKTYDAREGKITIKPTQAGVAEQVISVKQAQKDALIVEKTSYDMPFGGGEIEIKVEANVAFDVTPDSEWLHHVSTKALSSSTVLIKVDENATYSAREGKIEIAQQNGTLKHTITVKEAGRIAVTSVELDKANLTLRPEETATLVATVKPDNATDKTVTWTSSDTSIATVDETGKVTAIKDGSATITAKAGEKTAECKVEVSSIINFKDAHFKAYCLDNFDINGDGEISLIEALQVRTIDTFLHSKKSYNNIVSLNGIEFFKNLETLIFAGDVDTLDLSENVALKYLDFRSFVAIKKINLSRNSALEYVNFVGGDRYLTSLDLSNHTALQTLIVHRLGISQLNISGCSSLSVLDYRFNRMTQLDLSEFKQLKTFICDAESISSFDVGNCMELEKLICSGIQLNTLDLSNNKKLRYLDCQDCKLTSLDLSSNTQLDTLFCGSNNLSAIDLSNNKNIKCLSVRSCNLESLDIKNCLGLEELSCESNKLTSLDLSNNTALKNLWCGKNNLSNLDVSHNTALNVLNCYGNMLSSLDVRACPELQSLFCPDNSLVSLYLNNKKLLFLTVANTLLEELDLSSCESIRTIECRGNKLKNLDLHNNTNLQSIYCGYNLFSSIDVSNNLKMMDLICTNEPNLKEIWLKTGQTIRNFRYDDGVVVKYKD